MERSIGGLAVDFTPPEKAKFKPALILIHGLWSGSWCWHTWATHLSNLGWECYAANLRGKKDAGEPRLLSHLTYGDCLENVKRVVRHFDYPPVLVAHDLGGLLARNASEELEISALVLVSSLPPFSTKRDLPRTLRLLRLKYLPLLWLHRPFRLRESEFRQVWLAPLPAGQRADIVKAMVPDSAHLIAALFHHRMAAGPRPIKCPVLVMGGSEDRVVPVVAAREMSGKLGADLKLYPGRGHWIIEEEGSDQMVKDMHRWLVQSLGEKILIADLPDSG